MGVPGIPEQPYNISSYHLNGNNNIKITSFKGG